MNESLLDRPRVDITEHRPRAALSRGFSRVPQSGIRECRTIINRPNAKIAAGLLFFCKIKISLTSLA